MSRRRSAGAAVARQRGFTLLEIIVVVLVFSIMAAMTAMDTIRTAVISATPRWRPG